MPYRITTAPTASPVSLAEAKAQVAIDVSASDTRIQGYIDAATNWVEQATWRALVTQTVTLTLSSWPAGNTLWLPRPRLQSVTSVTYQDSNDETQTLDSENYRVDATGEVGRIALARNASWPHLAGNEFGDVTIVYVAGYGNAAAVPAALKQAVLLLVGAYEFDRENAKIPDGVMHLVRPFTIRDERLLEYVQ